MGVAFGVNAAIMQQNLAYTHKLWAEAVKAAESNARDKFLAIVQEDMEASRHTVRSAFGVTIRCQSW